MIVAFALAKIMGEGPIHIPTQTELNSYWLLASVLALARPLKHSRRDTIWHVEAGRYDSSADIFRGRK